MSTGLPAASFDDADDVPLPEPDYEPQASQSYSNRRYDNYRQPPHDNEAEQGVLGAMLLSPTTVVEIIETLTPEDFYRPAHQLIYTAIIDLFSDNKEIDPVIVSARLDRNNDLDRVGGAPYLHTLISSVPTAANARYYAEIVAEKAILRKLVDAGTRVVQLGYEGTEGAELDAVIDMAQQEVFGIAQKNTVDDYAILADLIKPTMDELDEIAVHGGLAQGIPTGFYDLDTLTNGLHGGQMIIVAARPGVGKSTLALDFVRSCSISNNKTAVIFSLEMSKSEIVMRPFTVQGGGHDLIFPHHELSAASAATVTNTPLAHLYSHTALVSYQGYKMSKSRGNLVFVSKLLNSGAEGSAIRLALLGHHYRTEWEWFERDLETAKQRLNNWRELLHRQTAEPVESTTVVAQLRAALANDLDTPLMLAIVDGAVAVGVDNPELLAKAIQRLLGVSL